MNILDKVLYELGISYYEKFKLVGQKNEDYYYFDKKGIVLVDNLGEEWDTASGLLEKIIMGEKKITPLLEDGDTYYFPYFRAKSGISSKHWSGSIIDKRIQRVVGCYKTEAKALKESKELDWYRLGDENK